MSFVWSHDDKEDTEYWKGLTNLHALIRYSVYGEIIISCAIICLLFIDYKKTYGNNLNPLNLASSQITSIPIIEVYCQKVVYFRATERTSSSLVKCSTTIRTVL